MYVLVKARLASIKELKESVTLDEALKLYSLYQMDQDIQRGQAEEMKRKVKK